MDTINKLCGLVDRKTALFREYEAQTNALTDCAPDDIPHYITKRSELAIEIDKIDAEIGELCGAAADGGQLRDALLNRCQYDALPPELRGLFERSQGLYAAVSRVRDLEPSIIQRMERLRDQYKELIASTKSTPKIARYLSDMGTRSENGMLLGERYSKV